MGEQPLLQVGTSDESSIIVESPSPAQQVKVNETNQKLVTSQDKEVVPEKNLSQENNYDPPISESEVNDFGQGGKSLAELTEHSPSWKLARLPCFASQLFVIGDQWQQL